MDHSLEGIISSLADRPGALDSTSLASSVSKHHVKITDHAIASAILLLAAHPEYPADVIGKGLLKHNDSVDWTKIFSIIKSPDISRTLKFEHGDSVISIITFIESFAGDRKQEGIRNFFAPGYHAVEVQIQFLRTALTLRDRLNYTSLGLKEIISQELLAGAPDVVQQKAKPLLSSEWNYQSFVELCLDGVVREDPNENSGKQLLEFDAKKNPELIFLAGVKMQEPWPAFLERILTNFLDLFYAGHPNAILVFYVLARTNSHYMLRALSEVFAREPTSIGRIVALSAESGLLENLAYAENFNFALELVAQADKQGLCSFENYIKDAEKNYTGEFIRVLLDYLEMKASVEYSQNQAGSTFPAQPASLNLRIVAVALSLITSVDIPQDRIEQFKSIQIQCLQAFPRLINYGQGHDAAILARGDTNTFPPEVEREMKMYYQKMYEQQIEIRDIITMLQRLKDSDDSHDQDVFACMVHSLFDEYRFFPEYPLNALATTAVLFGSLVYFHLIDGMPLSIALRFILESLRVPTEANMFRFGLQALFEFRQRLPEFPKYCAILLEIPGLATQQQFYQQIKDTVAGKRTEVEPDAISPVYKSVKADVKVDEGLQEDPSEAVSDKVLFLVNNLAQSNVAAKSKDLSAILDKKYHRWFANYIVGERSMREPNYHSLYIALLQELHDHNLEQYCLKTTYQLIIQYLDSPDTISSSDKRAHLKNLAQWLGSLLLGRDKPILYRNIAFKKLLVEADDLQQLSVVIPFVCKTLEKATSSTVFLPPNPWVMGILMVLSELYQFSDLKLNLKFEIEVLCNQFKVDINDIEASTIIRNHSTLEESQSHEGALALDMQRMRLQENHGVSLEEPAAPASAPQGLSAPSIPSQDGSIFTNLIAQLQLVGSTPFVNHPGFKKIFLLAVDQALREILQPVVERSVTIASITTKELVSKDFALEQDEQKMRLAAQNMVRVLAASISVVTCKDPLRESLATHLRSLMVTNGYADHDVLSEQIAMAVNDNIDVICSIVEESAISKSLPEIESALSPAYMLRKAHRESRSGQPFIDPQLNSRYPLQLPDPFRLKVGGLSSQQFAIYENFGAYHSAELTNEEAQPLAGDLTNAGNAPRQVGAPPALEDLEKRGLAPQSHFDHAILQMQNGMDSLEKLIRESKESSLSQLTSDHPISVLLTQILSVANRSLLKDQVILKTSQMAVSALFTLTDSQLGREVFCFLLDKLCELSATTAKEVVLWLIYSDDERKYNVPVMITLIKAKLITASEIDVNLAKQVLAKVEPAVNFAAGLIFEAVLGSSPCALRSEFTGCLAAMEALAKEEPDNKVARNLLAAMEKSVATGGPWALSAEGSSSTKDQMGYIFAEWVRLTQHPSRSDRSLHMFVYQLSKHGILSNGDLLCTFVRTALELSVESYKKGAAISNTQSSVGDLFVATDALAKLIATIIVTSNKMSTKARIEYLKNILVVIALVLASDMDSGAAESSERAYFRFFSTFLYEIITAGLPSEFLSKFYILVAEVFVNLQPQAFPEFSFAWEALISHRLFLPKIMDIPGKKGWPHIANLLSLLLKFQGRYIEGKEFPETISAMHKGTLRIFLVILHDYPEFLVEYHYNLCNAISSSFVQLRNLVLSAFPADIQLPDPLSSGFRIEQLAGIKASPELAVDPATDLQSFGIKKVVDTYIRSSSPATVKAILNGVKLPAPKKDSGIGFDSVSVNVPAINALILYIGVMGAPSAISDKPKDPSVEEEGILSHLDKNSEYLKLLTNLMFNANTETRYFISEAMANQLRYPNRHTHFFSCAILFLFGGFVPASLVEEKLAIQHLITRVLLERIICNRPHPWGLMITFTELLKNPSYEFWELPFTKSSVEVERMFLSLYSHISNSNRVESAAQPQATGSADLSGKQSEQAIHTALST